jgi:outer membrane protein assembly factor BamB
LTIALAATALQLLATMWSPVDCRADDWPQWMGPTRDGEYRETGLLDRFPDEGAKILWTTELGGGYSGPAVADGKVVVVDYVARSGEAFNNPGNRATLQGDERVLCFAADSGQPLWQVAYDCPYSISYPAGPRCTPTIDGDAVYTLGSEGDLHCIDLQTGEVRWRKSFKKDFGAEVPLWGFSAHPLIEGDLVICMVGGPNQTVMALDKKSGEVAWQNLTATEVGYCPPSIIEAAGRRQLIVWHADAIESLDPSDGTVFWSVPLKPSYGMAICRPQRDGDLLYASAIGNKSLMMRLKSDTPGVEELWSGDPTTSVYCANSTPIFFNGVIYGSDCGKGNFVAVAAEDGERLWDTFQPTRLGETRRISHGTAFVTHLADTDRYLLFSELGDLILATLTPSGYDEISRAHVIEPTGEAFGREVVWSHPAYANRIAFVRNDKQLVAVSLAP